MTTKFLVNRTNHNLVLLNDTLTVPPYKSVPLGEDFFTSISGRYMLSNGIIEVSDTERDFVAEVAPIEEAALPEFKGMTLAELQESEKEDAKSEKEGITVTPIGGTPQPAKAPKAPKATA